MKNQMKRIEKLGIGKITICLKPYFDEKKGEKIYPKKTTLTIYCSKNEARKLTDIFMDQSDGEISKIYWNGKLIEYKDLKVTHRAIAA